MNAFTVFIQNSSLVEKHEITVHYTTIQLYVSITLIWMIEYNHYLDYHFALGKFSVCRHNELSATHDEVDEPHGNWRVIVVQSECKTELTYHVVVCIFGRQEETVNQECLQRSN